MKLKCKSCKAEFEVDEKNIDSSLRWMQCPFCKELSKNPLFEPQ